VYVGGAGGSLHELDFAAANQATPPIHKVQALGDGTGQIGTPSLDIGVEPPEVTAGKKLLIVGSEAGVLYGVEVRSERSPERTEPRAFPPAAPDYTGETRERSR